MVARRTQHARDVAKGDIAVLNNGDIAIKPMDADKENSICVLMPCYNAGRSIERSLNSLLGQTYANWRAVVIDDGSTDDTRARLDELSARDDRIIWYAEEHGGAAAARNIALERAFELEPGYITFLDADDYLESDALEAMLEMARATGVDIVHAKYFSQYTSGYTHELKDLFEPGAVYVRSEFGRTVYWKMITGIQMNHVCTKLYRTELLRGMRFDTGMQTGEDLLMNMEVFTRAHSYAYLARPLYHYIRDTEGGLTNTGLSMAVKFRCNWRISKRMLELLPQWGIDTPYMRVCVRGRPACLLFSKAYRAFISKVGTLMGRRSLQR